MARIVYFSYLVDRLGRAQEDLALPENVQDVRGLLTLLRARGGPWEKSLSDDRIQVLVSKQSEQADTPIRNDQEITFVSNTPF